MARHDELIVGLDVGTTKICAVVAEPNGESIDVIGIGTHPSRGLRKGVVVDIEATVDSIRKAVDEAEMMAGCEISSVYAGIAGGHIQAHNEIGMIAIKDREVKASDLKRVIEQAQAIAIPADREVIHVIPQEYEIDGQDGIKHPVGMSGVRLIAKVHIVTAAVTSAQNVIKCANKAGLNVIDIVLEPLASAEATLAPDEKELGVALIDLGGGTTDLAVFADGSIKHTAVLSLGGYHLTNDAAVGLRTPFDQAERIKRRFGCAAARYLPREELLTVPSVGGRAPREVSRKILSEFWSASRRSCRWCARSWRVPATSLTSRRASRDGRLVGARGACPSSRRRSSSCPCAGVHRAASRGSSTACWGPSSRPPSGSRSTAAGARASRASASTTGRRSGRSARACASGSTAKCAEIFQRTCREIRKSELQ
jgi:cell division protein FtsA